MSVSLAGTIAMVTGGTSGIGLATARRFAAAGATVAIVGRDRMRGQSALASLAGDAPHSFHAADLGEEAAVRSVFAEIVDRHGVVHCAFNNAGAAAGAEPFLNVSTEHLDALLRINFHSIFWCMQAQIAHMLDHGGGAIVNCASIGGVVGAWNQAAYVASKHAVVGLTRAAGLEYAARGVRVNAICPGGVDTPLLRSYLGTVPQDARGRFSAPAIGRAAQPDEIAGLVLFLCSPDAAYIVAQAYPIDGGLTAA